MNHSVDPLGRIIKPSGIRKVVNLDKVKRRCVLRSGLDHDIAFRQRPGCSSHSEATAEQVVHDMSTDEPCSSRYKDVFSVQCKISDGK